MSVENPGPGSYEVSSPLIGRKFENKRRSLILKNSENSKSLCSLNNDLANATADS